MLARWVSVSNLVNLRGLPNVRNEFSKVLKV